MGQSILIVSPFKNESRSIPLYIEGLKNITYPHNLIDIKWIVNDSTDNTYDLLESSMPSLNFRSIELIDVILTKKSKPHSSSTYFKEYQGNSYNARMARVKAWIKMWNKYIFEYMKTSGNEYFVMWMGDCVPPPNVIYEYLKVFELKGDAGWVGGTLHRRHPHENLLCSPALPCINNGNKLTNIRNFKLSNEIVKAVWTGHCWMMPTHKVKDVLCDNEYVYDIHLSIIDKMKKMGLDVYYQPSVYIKHISADGKIYRESI